MEDLSLVENDIERRFGDPGWDVLVGDPEADRIEGEPGGVSLGVFVWGAKRRPYGIPGR